MRRALAVVLCLSLAGCAMPRPTVRVASGVEPVSEGGVRRHGTSWIRRDGPGQGILVGRFSGTPYEMGRSFGRLTRTRMDAQEQHLLRLFRALIPSPILREGILTLTKLRLRGLAREIPPELDLAIAGLAEGYGPGVPDAYARILWLHALHEESQRFVDAPGLSALCTGFLAPPHERSTETLLARNFDFEGGEILDREKLVAVFAPEGRIPYLSVTFGGMLGVVSGFNREGIGVAVQSIAGGPGGKSGTPMGLLLADVLQRESTLEGAIARLRGANVFVSDLILMADGRTGRTAVLELSPGRSDVTWGEGRPQVVGNEAVKLAFPLAKDATTRARVARLSELLSGEVTVEGAVALLRDRSTANAADGGFGNRNALAGDIAAHSVIFELGKKRAWVAAAPHTSGAYIPVDLEAVLADDRGTSPMPAPVVPAEPALRSGELEAYFAARRALLEGDAEEAVRLCPRFAEALAVLGEEVAHRGDRGRARTLLERALAMDPGPRSYREDLERLLAAVTGRGPLPEQRLRRLLSPDELIRASGVVDEP